jgi:hypothetical protein
MDVCQGIWHAAQQLAGGVAEHAHGVHLGHQQRLGGSGVDQSVTRRPHYQERLLRSREPRLAAHSENIHFGKVLGWQQILEWAGSRHNGGVSMAGTAAGNRGVQTKSSVRTEGSDVGQLSEHRTPLKYRQFSSTIPHVCLASGMRGTCSV